MNVVGFLLITSAICIYIVDFFSFLDVNKRKFNDGSSIFYKVSMYIESRTPKNIKEKKFEKEKSVYSRWKIPFVLIFFLTLLYVIVSSIYEAVV